VIAARRRVLDAAYTADPERFVNQRPSPPLPPTEVWINPPQQTQHQTTNREEACAKQAWERRIMNMR
jgi:hypothetical protein